jgi:hypothetical protein
VSNHWSDSGLKRLSCTRDYSLILTSRFGARVLVVLTSTSRPSLTHTGQNHSAFCTLFTGGLRQCLYQPVLQPSQINICSPACGLGQTTQEKFPGGHFQSKVLIFTCGWPELQVPFPTTLWLGGSSRRRSEDIRRYQQVVSYLLLSLTHLILFLSFRSKQSLKKTCLDKSNC